MEFLGIGPFELFFIVLLALILLGPKDMVKAGRTIGTFLRKTILSPEWINIQRSVRNLPTQIMREAGLNENDLMVGGVMKELNDAAAGVSSAITEASSTIKEELTIAPEWLNPPEKTKPESPTPDAKQSSPEPPPETGEDDEPGQN